MKIPFARAHRGSFRRARIATMAAAATALVGACATTPPPTEQVAATTAAVAHAAGAGGNEWAPQEMKAARDKLQRANVAMAAKDYPVAISLTREAQVDAELAEAKAESVKARRAADAMRDGNRVLRDELERKSQ